MSYTTVLKKQRCNHSSSRLKSRTTGYSEEGWYLEIGQILEQVCQNRRDRRIAYSLDSNELTTNTTHNVSCSGDLFAHIARCFLIGGQYTGISNHDSITDSLRMVYKIKVPVCCHPIKMHYAIWTNDLFLSKLFKI